LHATRRTPQKPSPYKVNIPRVFRVRTWIAEEIITIVKFTIGFAASVAGERTISGEATTTFISCYGGM